MQLGPGAGVRQPHGARGPVVQRRGKAARIHKRHGNRRAVDVAVSVVEGVRVPTELDHGRTPVLCPVRQQLRVPHRRTVARPSP